MKRFNINLKKLSLTACTLAICAIPSFGWGRVGHDAVSYIAECHLTPTAKANVEKYLNGNSIVYDSSWPDLVRETPEYKHTTRCHMYPVGKDGKYHSHPDGDAVSLINEQTALLKNYKNLSDSAVNVGIKLLVHIIGDLHCPSHPDFDEIYQWYNFDMNGMQMSYHGYWDWYAIETHHKWYYTDYQHQLDRYNKKQIKEICQGTPEDWANETAKNVAVTYDWIKKDMSINKMEANLLLLKGVQLADSQIVKAGYRLSHVLNTLFDPKYK